MKHNRYDCRVIANEFIRLSLKHNNPISPMTIQKLIYFANGIVLTLTGTPLVRESFEAWSYGPVIPLLYHTLKAYGAKPIQEPICLKKDSVNKIDPGVLVYIEITYEKYNAFSAITLSNMTHEKGGAWDKAELNQTLNDEDIKKEFNFLLEPTN